MERFKWTLFFTCIFVGLAVGSTDGVEKHDYCIIGAGPGGVQLGYFFQQSQRDYIILEQKEKAGAFFAKFPRMRRLISINKRFTGSTNPEFNLRHDWNSLLTHESSFRFTNYSELYYPDPNDLVKYLADFSHKYQLRIRFNTQVIKIAKEQSSSLFLLSTASGPTFSCKYTFLATGFSQPNIPSFIPSGLPFFTYHNVSLDLKNFEGKRVLIFGKGNSALELFDHMNSVSAYVHLVSRSPARFSFFTHYVGDLRALNVKVLDHYQLKSLDALIDGEFENDVQLRLNDDGKIVLGFKEDRVKDAGHNHVVDDHNTQEFFQMRDPYDLIIVCTGFLPDRSPFSDSSVKPLWHSPKYAQMDATFQSVNVPNLYFLGTLMHGRDFRKSSGGFIHGFRYLAQHLFRVLEKKHHDVPWPRVEIEATSSGIASQIISRVNEASAMYQMFGFIGDAIFLPKKKKPSPTSTEFYPAHYFPDIYVNFTLSDPAFFREKVPHQILIVTLEFGKGYSGPNVLREDRAQADPEFAHTSRFLHPIVREYFRQKGSSHFKLVSEHHVLEDILSRWDSPEVHTNPLKEYLRAVLTKSAKDNPKYAPQPEDYNVFRSSVQLYDHSTHQQMDFGQLPPHILEMLH